MSNTIVPIIIPVNHEPDRCPKCKKIEDIAVVCRNCGYEYEDEDEPFRWWEVALIILICAFILWAFCTLVVWMADYDDTLWSMLKGQWAWLVKLFGRIY